MNFKRKVIDLLPTEVTLSNFWDPRGFHGNERRRGDSRVGIPFRE